VKPFKKNVKSHVFLNFQKNGKKRKKNVKNLPIYKIAESLPKSQVVKGITCRPIMQRLSTVSITT